MDEVIAIGTRTGGGDWVPPILKLLRTLVPVADWLFARFSRVADQAFFDVRDFAWAEEVERSWRALRDQAIRLDERQVPVPPFEEISPDQLRLTGNGRWKVFFFVAYGVPVEANLRQFPASSRFPANLCHRLLVRFAALSPWLRRSQRLLTRWKAAHGSGRAA